MELDISMQSDDIANIICRDTGEGISCNSVESLGEMFSSSKCSTAPKTFTSGKFGIGLKTVSCNRFESNCNA
ncbi:putative Dna topoisomerase 6 subunit B [Cardiosporidium cionae]|uniref:Dna topoisomerase 6 subunit B n=1 Tax=Cardiosporidium cionae TaxID=476202 RepID=A0ABQ7JBL0_9APIC|nr:putative Dna topoisomerase 6 subunit B [Cardiosporidium cionae]|eukprot:KAF8821382.1 putative Dna topoisomerase 6 subunit B [Cardiosporidium cionae]